MAKAAAGGNAGNGGAASHGATPPPNASAASAPPPSSIPSKVGAGGANAASSPAASPAPGSNAPEGETGRPARRVSVVPGVTPDPAGDEELGGEPHPQDEGFRRILNEADAENPPATGAGKDGGEGETQTAEAATPPPPPQKFKLKDVEFDSEDHAAHAYKTLRGQAAAVSARARELNSQQQELVSALAAAGLELQNGKVTRAANAPVASPGASPSMAPPASRGATEGDSPSADLSSETGVQSFLDSALDWKQLPQLIKYYEEQHGQTLGPAVAMRLVMETVLPKLWKHFDSHVGKTVEPFQNVVGSIQASTAVRDLFVGMRDYTYHDGSPAYPELATDDGLADVYRVWMDLGNMGIPPKVILSPQGVQIAVSLLRDLNSMKSRAAGPQPTAQPSRSLPASNTPPPQMGANVDAATAAVEGIMRSLESARGAVNPDLPSGAGQPFRPAGMADDYASRLKKGIRDSRGKEVIPGVRFS